MSPPLPLQRLDRHFADLETIREASNENSKSDQEMWAIRRLQLVQMAQRDDKNEEIDINADDDIRDKDKPQFEGGEIIKEVRYVEMVGWLTVFLTVQGLVVCMAVLLTRDSDWPKWVESNYPLTPFATKKGELPINF